VAAAAGGPGGLRSGRVDRSTSIADLASLARTPVGVVSVLPVRDPVGATIARPATQATTAAVAGAEMSCAG
jgi:hypothetical protein